MEIKLLNAIMLQLNTTIQRLALFKLILYSNLLTIINIALYFTFDSFIFLTKIKIKIKLKADLPTLFQIIRRPETNIFFCLALTDKNPK